MAPRTVGGTCDRHDPESRADGKHLSHLFHLLDRIPNLLPDFLKVFRRNQVTPIRQRDFPVLHKPLQGSQHTSFQHLDAIQHTQLSFPRALDDPFVFPVSRPIAPRSTALQKIAGSHFLVAMHRLGLPLSVAQDGCKLFQGGGFAGSAGTDETDVGS